MMQTAYLQSTVITQAPLFRHHKTCMEMCCAQAVAISLKQDRSRIINAVEGQDVADLLLFGNQQLHFNKFHASKLTDEVIPCLQPGVIIHADSYRWVQTNRLPCLVLKCDTRTDSYSLLYPRTEAPSLDSSRSTAPKWPFNTCSSPRKQTAQRLSNFIQSNWTKTRFSWLGTVSTPATKLEPGTPKFYMMSLGLTGKIYYQAPDLDLLMKARNYTNLFAGDKSKWTNQTVWSSAKDTTSLLFVKFGLHSKIGLKFCALHRGAPFSMACENRTMPPLDNLSCNMGIGVNLWQTYTAASKYLFGLSPPGNSLDCFRTYELLLNGVISVVLYQPEYEELFNDLPILQLKQWN